MSLRKTLIIIISIIVVLLFGTIYYLFETNAGLIFTFDFINKVLPGKLSYGHAEGRLASQWHIDEFSYTDKQTNIAIESFTIDWQAYKLLLGELKINQFAIGETRITIKKDKTQSLQSSSMSFGLPFKVFITEGTIGSIKIKIGDNPEISLERASFHTLKNKRLSIEWNKLHIPISNTALIKSKQGEIILKGNYDQATFNLNAIFKGHNAASETIQADGSFEDNTLEINNLNAHILRGTLKGTASLQFDNKLKWLFKLSGKNLNPSEAWASWPGNLNFSVIGSGILSGNKQDFNINLKKLNGTLRDNKISGKAKVIRDNDNYVVENAELNVENAHIKINGIVKDKWNLDWSIHIPNMNRLFPYGQGHFDSEGKLRGSRQSPHINANISAKGLMTPFIQAENIQGKFNTEWPLKNHSKITLTATKVGFNQNYFDSINIQGESNKNKQTLSADLSFNKNKILLTLSGIISNNKWQGRISQLDLNSLKVGNWSLKKPINIEADSKKINIPQFCWHNKENKICASGNWYDAEHWEYGINSNEIPMKLFQALISDDVKIEGNGQITVNAKRSSAKKLAFDGKLSLSEGTYTYPVGPYHHQVKFKNGILTAKLSKTGFITEFNLNTGPQPVAAYLELPGYQGNGLPSQNQKILGKAQANFKTLGLLPLMLPDLHNSQGQLDIYLTLNGTIQKPIITGKLSVMNASTELPRFGLKLQDIHINLASDEQNKLHLTGSLISDKGKLNIAGEASPFEKGFPASIEFNGSNLLILSEGGYKIYIDPNLKIHFKDHHFTINGNINIPIARIRPRSFGDDYIELPNDIRYVNALGEPVESNVNSAFSFSYSTDIEMTLGNDVKIDAFGIEGKLSGNLGINKEPGANATGTGKLSVENGTYRAYGRKLDIETGQLIFTGGSVTNPGLNICASRQVSIASQVTNLTTGNITSNSQLFVQTSLGTVGVMVQGTVQKPDIILFSEPGGLSQTDIISYLAFGTASNGISGNAGSLLLSALTSTHFGDPNKEDFNDSFQHILGLDELGFQSGTLLDPVSNTFVQNTYLVIGKSLSSRFSMSVSVGLVDSVSFVRAKCLIGHGWLLQIEASTESIYGGDLLYTFSIK